MSLEEVSSITDEVLPQLLGLGASCCNGSAYIAVAVLTVSLRKDASHCVGFTVVIRIGASTIQWDVSLA